MRRTLLGLLFFTVLAWLAYLWSENAVNPSQVRGVRSDSLVGGFRAVRLYFASNDGARFAVESREVHEPVSLHDMVAMLVAELDRGPHATGVAVLPAGTSVLGVYMDEGVLTVDLSRAFLQGFQGGSSVEYLALGTLVRTLGANIPDVDRVLLLCGGATLNTLGGHIPLDRPLEIDRWALPVAGN